MFIKEYLNQAINKVGLEVTQPIHGVLIIYYDEYQKHMHVDFLKVQRPFLFMIRQQTNVLNIIVLVHLEVLLMNF